MESMRLPSSVFKLTCYAAVLAVAAGSIALFGAAKKTNFSRHDKAYYADPLVIEYVQPGLAFTVVSSNIAKDGTISVDFKVADPSGAPLDRSGVVTPGAVSSSFLIAYIPKGQTQYASYITRSVTSTNGNLTTGAGSSLSPVSNLRRVSTDPRVYRLSSWRSK